MRHTRNLIAVILLTLVGIVPGLASAQTTVRCPIAIDATLGTGTGGNSTAASTNFGGTDTTVGHRRLAIGFDPTNAVGKSRYYGYAYPLGYTSSLMKFDLSCIPAGATITSAAIYLDFATMYYTASRYAVNMRLYRVTSPWTEYGVTFNTKPTWTSVSTDVMPTTGAAKNYFTLASVVQGWVNGTYPNNGVRLEKDDVAADMLIWFGSREYGINVPELVVTYTGGAPTTGNLEVTVRNSLGALQSGALCQLYNPSWQYLGGTYPDQPTNASGVCGWASLPPANYRVQVYYSGPSPFPGGEYWGYTQEETVSAGGTRAVGFQRMLPYATQMELRLGSASGAVLGPSSKVAPGQTVWVGVTVTQSSGVSQSARVRALIDASQSAPYDSDQYLTLNPGDITSGGNRVYSGTMTVSAAMPQGAYYRALLVETSQAGTWVKTDGWQWYGAFSVEDPKPGEFLLSNPGDQAELPATTKTVDLTWTMSPRANYYEVYFGTSPVPPKIDEVTATSRTVDVESGRTYYWWINAVNGSGTKSTSVRSFSVIAGAPGSFTLSLPVDEASLPATTTSVYLEWQPSASATSYDVYFGESPSFGPPTNVSTTNTSRAVEDGKTYYWTVVARNSIDTRATSSGTWQVTIQPGIPPGPFSLTSPDSGATLPSTATSVTLMWGNSSGATSYDVYFGESPSFGPPSNVAGGSTTRSAEQGKTYYWTVKARNQFGETPTSSGTRQFRVTSAYGNLRVTVRNAVGSPQGGALCQLYAPGWSYLGSTYDRNTATDGLCAWDAIPTASYRVQVYYSGPSPFPGGEYWGYTEEEVVPPADTRDVSFQRMLPYGTQLELRRGGEAGELLGPESAVGAGETVWVGVALTQTSGVTQAARVRAVIDADQAAPFAWDQYLTPNPGDVASGGTRRYTGTMTLGSDTSAGAFYRALLVETWQGGAWVKTDGWQWYGAFTARRDVVASMLGPAVNDAIVSLFGQTYTVYTFRPGTGTTEIQLPFIGHRPDPSEATLVKQDPELARLVLMLGTFESRYNLAVENVYLDELEGTYGVDAWYDPRTWLGTKKTRMNVGQLLMWAGNEAGKIWATGGASLVGIPFGFVAQIADLAETSYAPEKLRQEVQALAMAHGFYGQEMSQLARLISATETPNVTMMLKLGAFGGESLQSFIDYGMAAADAKAALGSFLTGPVSAMDANWANFTAARTQMVGKVNGAATGLLWDGGVELLSGALGWDTLSEEIEITTMLSDAHVQAIHVSARELVAAGGRIGDLKSSGDSAAARAALRQSLNRYAWERAELLPDLLIEDNNVMALHLSRVAAHYPSPEAQLLGASSENIAALRDNIDYLKDERSSHPERRYASFLAEHETARVTYEAVLDTLAEQHSASLLHAELPNGARVYVDPIDPEQTRLVLRLHNRYAQSLAVTDIQSALARGGIESTCSARPTIAAGEYADVELAVSVPSTWFTLEGDGGELVNLNVSVYWSVGGEAFGRILPVTLTVAPHGRFSSFRPDKSFYYPGDTAIVWIAHEGTTVTAPLVVGLLRRPNGTSGGEIGFGPDGVGFSLGNGPYGPYGLTALLRQAGTGGQVAIPWYSATNVFYLLPPVEGDLKVVRGNGLKIVYPRADVDAARDIRGVLNLPAESMVEVESASFAQLEAIAEAADTILVGGAIANPLVGELISRGRLTLVLENDGDAAVRLVHNSFGTMNSVVVAGFRQCDTSIAALSLARSWNRDANTHGQRGDFSGDLKSDILWRRATQGDVWLWPMDGGARTAETYVRTVAEPGWEIRGLGDQTGDGRADILWRHAPTGMLYLWRMNGEVVEAETYVGLVEPAYDIVGTGDYNGDGTSDILWRHLANGELWMWLMDGPTPLSVSYVDTVDPDYEVQGSGDLNNDKRADIVWRHATQGDVWVWLMNGPVPQTVTYVRTVGELDYRIVGVADHTGDGKADILWHHATRGEVWLWPMDGTTLSSQAYVDTVPETDYRIVGNGDYDGDGKADILWHHATRGEVWVWLMSGPVRLSQHYVGSVPDVGYQIVKVK